MGIIVLSRGVEISTLADTKTILFHQQNPPQSPQQIKQLKDKVKTHGALYQKGSKPSSRTIHHSHQHLHAENRRKKKKQRHHNRFKSPKIQRHKQKRAELLHHDETKNKQHHSSKRRTQQRRKYRRSILNHQLLLCFLVLLLAVCKGTPSQSTNADDEDYYIINNSPTNNEYQSLHQTDISNTSVTVNNEVPPLSASVVGQRSETIPLLSTVSRVRRFVLRLRGHLDDDETGVIHNGGGRYGGDGHPGGGGDDRGPPSRPQPYHQQRDIDLLALDQQYGNRHYDEHTLLNSPEARRVLREFDDDIYNGYGFDYEHPPEIRDLDLLALDQQYGNRHYDEHTLLNSPEARRALREFNDIYNGYDFDYEHPPEIWNNLHMDGNDNEVVVVEPDVIAEPVAAEPDTTPIVRHRVIASIDQYDITSDGGNEAISNIGSRVSDGSDSPLFSDPVEVDTSPSGSYSLDPSMRGGATNNLMSESDELLNDDEPIQGSQLMAEENQNINLQASAAENQGSALLSHMEDEVPDQPTPPATDSPSEQTKRRRTGGFGCISTLARPVAGAASSIARHSGSAASAIRNSPIGRGIRDSPIGRRVSTTASRLGMRPRDSMALDSPAGSESSTNDAEWTLDDEAIDVAITNMGIDEGLTDGLMNDIEMSFGGIDIESEIDDEPVISGKQECARATTDIGRLLLKVFDLLGFGNQEFVSAALGLVESGEEGFELSEAASFREFLIYITERVLQRFDDALSNPHSMDVDEVELAVNQDRDDIFDKMWKTLRPVDRPRINASHPHSRSTMGIAGLHYSPDGTPQIDKHTMPYNQCCVRGIINSVTRAVFYAINAPEKSEAEYNNVIQGIDMACTTAIKKKKFADLESQYWKDAKKLGLKSVQEYYLINMLQYINSHTLFMVANKGNDKEMMTIVASSALAKEVFGKNTKQRFVEKIEKVKSIVYFTLHPQALMMGQGKSKHYDGIRSTMNEHVLTFYAHMLDCTYDDVQPELREFFEWFGKEWIDNDIEMGILSLLAKHMADQGELSVSNINSIKESNIVDEGIKKLFDNQKKLHGEDKLMKLLRRFRAGHFLQTLASQLNADGYENITFSSLAGSLKRDIKKVAKILDLTENQVISRLKRIKKNQIAGGKRLSLLNKLASKLGKFGVTAVKEELGELMTLLKSGSTEEDALRILENQVRLQEQGGKRLSLLATLASVYSKEGEASVKLRQEFQELLGLLVEGTKDEEVLQMIQNQVRVQEQAGKRSSLLAQLASEYRKGGEDAVRTGLADLVKLLKERSTEEDALQAVLNTVLGHKKRVESTFNHYYNLLVDYIETYQGNKEKPIIFNVNGNDVLIVRESTSPSSDLDRLAVWWRDQINLTGRAEQNSDYGILAFTDPASEYYTKLDDLRAFTFDTALVNRAIEMSLIKKYDGKSNLVDGMKNIGKGFDFGNKDKSKKPKRKKREKKREDNNME